MRDALRHCAASAKVVGRNLTEIPKRVPQEESWKGKGARENGVLVGRGARGGVQRAGRLMDNWHLCRDKPFDGGDPNRHLRPCEGQSRDVHNVADRASYLGTRRIAVQKSGADS